MYNLWIELTATGIVPDFHRSSHFNPESVMTDSETWYRHKYNGIYRIKKSWLLFWKIQKKIKNTGRMRRTDPSNKNRPEGNTNTLPPPTYTRIYPRCFNSTVIYMCRCPALNPRKHRRLLVWQVFWLAPIQTPSRRRYKRQWQKHCPDVVKKLTAAGPVRDLHPVPFYFLYRMDIGKPIRFKNRE